MYFIKFIISICNNLNQILGFSGKQKHYLSKIDLISPLNIIKKRKHFFARHIRYNNRQKATLAISARPASYRIDLDATPKFDDFDIARFDSDGKVLCI